MFSSTIRDLLTFDVQEEMKNCRRLTSYFNRAEPEEQPTIQRADEDIETGREDYEDLGERIDVAISKLEEVTKLHRNTALEKNDRLSKFDSIRHLCVLRFLRKIQQNPRSRMLSSKAVAEAFFGPEKGSDYKARCIRIWSDEYLRTHTLTPYRQGKHRKVESLVDDHDIKQALVSILRSQRAELIEARSFARWIAQELHLNESLGLLHPVVVSESTASRWLHILGFRLTERKNGVYIDGHEREDVVAYRKEYEVCCFSKCEMIDCWLGF